MGQILDLGYQDYSSSAKAYFFCIRKRKKPNQTKPKFKKPQYNAKVMKTFLCGSCTDRKYYVDAAD